MEVSLESSFQPTVQLYLLLPSLIHNMTKVIVTLVSYPTISHPQSKIEITLFTVCKDGDLPILQADQTISIITSILG